jgi:hypothetical protein
VKELVNRMKQRLINTLLQNVNGMEFVGCGGPGQEGPMNPNSYYPERQNTNT